MTVRLLKILLSLIPIHALSQDLTGTWEGSGGMTTYVKLVIVRSGNQYVGYAYDEGMGYCKTNFLGAFDSTAKKLRGKSMGFIEKTLLHGQSMFNLNYSENGNTGMLKGMVSPKTTLAKIGALGMTDPVTLTRTMVVTDTTAYMKKILAGALPADQPEAPETLRSPPVTGDDALKTMLNVRYTDTTQVVAVGQPKIKIRVIDNGIEDGDSISIFCDDKIVVRRYVVSHLPYEFEVTFEKPGAEHSITLLAHNLGTIPPNTATIVIASGQKTYTVHASTSMERNAMIRVRFVP